MDKNHQGKSDSECFELFSNSPKEVTMEVVKGAHKFIAKVIRDDEKGPTIQSLIKIFDVFSQQKIKKYVFTRMTKPILLELALCIIQEIALNGAERAQKLQLEVVQSKSGGKTVKIADPFDEDPTEGYDADFLEKIDEAFFKLRDSEGKSPDVNLVTGQGHKAPYSPFGKDGSFIRPDASAVRSLETSLEVRASTLDTQLRI